MHAWYSPYMLGTPRPALLPPAAVVRSWKGDEYKAMVGVAGMVSPYMSGWCSFLSRKLIGHIVDDDWAHTVLANQCVGIGNLGCKPGCNP